MNRFAKISTIKREYSDSQLQTMQASLSKRGFTRSPGTGVYKFPYKEIDGRYRTGLDEHAAYIQRISDPVGKEIEIKRVRELKKKLEDALGNIDLGPRSDFWNYGKSQGINDTLHVQAMKLMDGDNIFDLGVPFQELTFAWLRVHPTIASSLQAWERGEYPADTQFYVVDDDLENVISYNKKKRINKAISKFDSMSPEKKRKVARMFGLPVVDNTKEEVVYNMIDNLLKQSEMNEGKFKGLDPVEVFTRFADMADDLLHIRDLVKQAITHSIYRVRNGKIYEGEYELAKDEDDLVKFLIDTNNQDALLELEGKLKLKKGV